MKIEFIIPFLINNFKNIYMIFNFILSNNNSINI